MYIVQSPNYLFVHRERTLKQFMISTHLFLLAREFLKECIFDAFDNSFSNHKLKTNTSSNVLLFFEEHVIPNFWNPNEYSLTTI